MAMDFSKLKAGEKLSETSFYTYVRTVGDQAELKMEDGTLVTLTKKYIDAFVTSADQFTSTETITQTEMAEKFLIAINTVFTVSFNKKVDPKEVLKQILDTHNNSAPKDVESNFKKTIKTALEGQERLLTGFHYGSQDKFGRIQVTDLNIAADPAKTGQNDPRLRLVDPRTINFLILRGVKYIVK